TNEILSPSCFTVPFKLFRGADADADLWVSQPLAPSWARAATFAKTQTANARINSFFIVRNLLFTTLHCSWNPASLVRSWRQFGCKLQKNVTRRTVYFSRATTNSGAQSRARLISESGNVQIALRADSEYCAAWAEAESSDP